MLYRMRTAQKVFERLWYLVIYDLFSDLELRHPTSHFPLELRPGCARISAGRAIHLDDSPPVSSWGPSRSERAVL